MLMGKIVELCYYQLGVKVHSHTPIPSILAFVVNPGGKGDLLLLPTCLHCHHDRGLRICYVVVSLASHVALFGYLPRQWGRVLGCPFSLCWRRVEMASVFFCSDWLEWYNCYLRLFCHGRLPLSWFFGWRRLSLLFLTAPFGISGYQCLRIHYGI